MQEIIVGKNEANQRADKLLQKVLSEASVGFIYKMIRKKNITLNDKKLDGKEILQPGDSVKIWFSDETFSKFSPKTKNINETNHKAGLPQLDIVFEDDDIVIFNKPAGLLSQRAEYNDISVNDCLIQYLLETKQITNEELKTFKPSISNRLDRNTSGLIVCGKSLHGLQEVARQLKEHACKKDYLAIVSGEIREPQTLKGFLEKDNSKNIVSIGDKGDYIETSFKPCWIDNNKTGLMVRILTGKTHQIRSHLASINHPILGDIKYGSHIKCRLQLHAYQLTLADGRKFTAPIPEDFKWEHSNPEDFEALSLRN